MLSLLLFAKSLKMILYIYLHRFWISDFLNAIIKITDSY